jgi:hypothetical protein
MYVTKPYKFTGFGAMDATKPYKCIGFGAIKFIHKVSSTQGGKGAIHPRPQRPGSTLNTHGCDSSAGTLSDTFFDADGDVRF